MSAALRRAASTPLLVALILLVAGVAVAGAALVGFSAEARNQSSAYAAGWLGAPTSLAAPVPLGDGATLTWAPATHGLRAGTDTQAITGSLFSSNPTNCNSATYTDFSTTGLATSVTTTNDNRGSSFSGYWACYRVESRRATWSTGANFSLVQIGLVPAGVAAVSVGSHAGEIEQTDRIELTFNQAIAYTGASTITVCTFSGNSGAGSILIGASSCSNSGNATTIGKVTGLTIGNNRTYSSSTAAVVGSTLRITIGGAGRSTVTAVSPVFTYTGSATLITSSGGSPIAQVCTVTARCPWTVSGSF